MRLLVLIVAAFSLAGCKSACRQLSEKLCDCAINSLERDACLRTASAAEGSNLPTMEQDEYCNDLLKPMDGGVGCDCRLIDTKAGKIRCGLAKPDAPMMSLPDGGP